ncbi:nitrogenase [Acididesulfobacillus acetoxydans]|uniref:Nitrogenase iron-molybdenum cofactor biosynthesis protein NifE n=1 Tax=Acididesulfobacillus acetoxydans TaxID=1561005 RepID=A0A8S0VXU8_9FIRM|nr:nitrogenase iron-molybdenum cofactor biosynthesis protein NifE [Acididesulfobacillus acetoxydans]CAA7602343.1 nitrogenase [Acididesulfobacillus acetoxydans]CEJ08422.1 Nitrogenase iron-molybdenum cofactor biosynthesis protein NifE [Acididesulfobacillus acetoxydans]
MSNPITDAAHLIHGPIACAGNSWDNRGALSTGSQLYRRGFTTDLGENDVVYGGEEKLYQAILEISAKHRPQAIFVYSTCVSALIGDDLAGVCARAQKKVSLPVIPVDAPGFLGDKNIGNRIAGETLWQRVIGSKNAGAPKIPRSINLIGEYNIAGDLGGILPDLTKLGIKLQTAITGDARYADLTQAHRAALNVLVCSKSLTNLACSLQQQWQTPYIEASFYGIEDTSQALRNIARGLGDRGLSGRTEEYIRRQEKETRQAIAPYRERLQGKRAVLFTGGVKTWSMVSALTELGITILAGGTQNSTPADFERMKARLDPAARIIEDTSAVGFLTLIREKKPDLLVAGGKIKYLAHKMRLPFLDINHGRKRPYAGYPGMITLAEAIARTVFSPVWDLSRRPYPPARGGEGGNENVV